ncbi:MAG: hypothetical protein HDS68_09630 [Bacteroidales bacterium]|nr:hypothetical protein [Bacteroidales bacterium]
MKKICALISGILAIAISSCSSNKTDYEGFGTGIIRVTGDFSIGNRGGLMALPPQPFNSHINEYFTSPPFTMQFDTTWGKQFSFHTVSFPAMYYFDDGEHADINILAMPGDTITIDYSDNFIPTVSGPKVTTDYYNTSVEIYMLDNKRRQLDRPGSNATPEEIAKADEEYHQALEALFRKNTDNAGSIAVMWHIGRENWDRLLPEISTELRNHPLLAPSLAFMHRCVNYGIVVTPAEEKTFTPEN